MVNRETEHYQEFVSNNRNDLEQEFVKNLKVVVLDDELPDYLDCNNDAWNDFCDEQYSLADHEVYN